jgi:poly-gamma-glutamate capsule biosynthesis protein CapA/YwtB (metallophosphatase superfamily)
MIRLAILGQSYVADDLADGLAHPASRPLAALLAGAHVAFTNVEGVVAPSGTGWPTRDTLVHRAAPGAFDRLVSLGVNAVSLANNHAFDLGPPGVLATLDAVASRGMLFAGTGVDATAAAQPGLETLRGAPCGVVAFDCGGAGRDSIYALDPTAKRGARPGVARLKVTLSLEVPEDAFATLRQLTGALGHSARSAMRVRIGFDRPSPDDRFDLYGTTVVRGTATAERRAPDADDRARVLDAIRTARAFGGAVIACAHNHHWEPDWTRVPDWMETLARDCVDAGADVFVGHGVPLMQGVAFHRGRPLLFGMGNFVFHAGNPGRFDEETWEGAVAEVALPPDGPARLTLRPILVGGRPSGTRRFAAPCIADPVTALRTMERVAARSAPFGTRFRPEGDAWIAD